MAISCTGDGSRGRRPTAEAVRGGKSEAAEPGEGRRERLAPPQPRDQNQRASRPPVRGGGARGRRRAHERKYRRAAFTGFASRGVVPSEFAPCSRAIPSIEKGLLDPTVERRAIAQALGRAQCAAVRVPFRLLLFKKLDAWQKKTVKWRDAPDAPRRESNGGMRRPRAGPFKKAPSATSRTDRVTALIPRPRRNGSPKAFEWNVKGRHRGVGHAPVRRCRA